MVAKVECCEAIVALILPAEYALRLAVQNFLQERYRNSNVLPQVPIAGIPVLTVEHLASVLFIHLIRGISSPLWACGGIGSVRTSDTGAVLECEYCRINRFEWQRPRDTDRVPTEAFHSQSLKQ